MEHQRCANKPAQGNALGKLSNYEQALKGRNIVCAAPSGLGRCLPSYPGRCPGLVCLRAVGPPLLRCARQKVYDRLELNSELMKLEDE